MENASKALIIAGAILISILIVGLGVIIYNNVADIAGDTSGINQQAVSSHNSPIESYFGDQVTGSNVRALITYVNGINRTARANDEVVGNYIYLVSNENDISSGEVTSSNIKTGRSYKVYLSTEDDLTDDEKAGTAYWKNGYIKTIYIDYAETSSTGGNG